MTDNFFLDNLDLQFRLGQLDLRDILEIKEKGYTLHEAYADAPRNYADAIDNFRLQLEILGDISANIVAPTAAEADEKGAQYLDGNVEYADVTKEGIEAFKQAELMGAMLPREYGGLNLPETIYQMMVEIVSRAEAGLMTVFGLQEIAASINDYADEETKARILPRFGRGEVSGAMVLTEPDAGSDLGNVQTKATYDEEAGFWRLNGVKRFITNGNADVQVVLARSEEGSTDARGLSLFVIERDESVRIRRIENKLGIHASPTCEIQYKDTPAWLIGKRRFGLIRYAMALMNGARLAVGAQAVGIAEAAYREAYKYANERIQFNQPIMNLPAVSRMLLSMRGELEASRALICEAGVWVDRLKAYEERIAEGDTTLRQDAKVASNLADVLTPLTKYYTTEMANRVCYLAMQIHGGVGYMREFNVERHFRDVRVTNIYEGTSQMQIVAALGKLLGHALDDRLDQWASQDYGTDLEDLKEQLIDATDLLKKATDALKEKERDLIDYYAVDLADSAAYVVNSWLLLQDALQSDRKCELARIYITEHLPKIHAAGEIILAANEKPLTAREKVLAEKF
jgi:alkylation response protein AidB-like acyl-CoA dehydrogenase